MVSNIRENLTSKGGYWPHRYLKLVCGHLPTKNADGGYVAFQFYDILNVLFLPYDDTVASVKYLVTPYSIFDKTGYIIDYIVLEMIYRRDIQAFKEYGRVSQDYPSAL